MEGKVKTWIQTLKSKHTTCTGLGFKMQVPELLRRFGDWLGSSSSNWRFLYSQGDQLSFRALCKRSQVAKCKYHVDPQENWIFPSSIQSDNGFRKYSFLKKSYTETIFKAIQTIFYLMKLKINTILVNFLLIILSLWEKTVKSWLSSVPSSFFVYLETFLHKPFFYWGKIYLTNFTSLSIFKCTFSGTNGIVTQASPLPPEFFHHPIRKFCTY